MPAYDRLMHRRRIALVRDAAFILSVGVVATVMMRVALALP